MDVKDELKNTSIQITCLDENGNVLKRVTSGDSGEIEDNENGGSTESGSEGGNTNGGSSEGGNTEGGNTGGNTGGSTGGDGGDDDDDLDKG